MKVIVHPLAEKELEAVFDYYAELDKDLSLRFWNEFQNGIIRIKLNPAAWTHCQNNCRRYLLNRFPYAIIYRKNDSQIEVIALMHLKRKPEYWTSRI